RGRGSRTVTRPLAEASSLALTVVFPTLTRTVPAGFGYPLALMRTTTLARLPADFTFAVTFGFAFLTLTAFDDDAPSSYPALLAVTRTETRLPTSFFLSVYVRLVAPLIALPPRSHW